MNDIKLSELGNIDYIPKKHGLCESCIFYEECPYSYLCQTAIRFMEYERESEEL